MHLPTAVSLLTLFLATTSTALPSLYTRDAAPNPYNVHIRNPYALGGSNPSASYLPLSRRSAYAGPRAGLFSKTPKPGSMGTCEMLADWRGQNAKLTCVNREGGGVSTACQDNKKLKLGDSCKLY